VSPTGGSPAGTSRTVMFAVAKEPSAESVYLLLVLAALAAVGGSILIRILGVRVVLGSFLPARHRSSPGA
jgi:hypothetical protein